MSDLMERVEYALTKTSNEIARLEDVRILREVLWDARVALRWIPCEERLPETSGNYRTTLGVTPVGASGVLSMLSFTYFDAKNRVWLDESVIAWKEKPVPYIPPKEES